MNFHLQQIMKGRDSWRHNRLNADRSSFKLLLAVTWCWFHCSFCSSLPMSLFCFNREPKMWVRPFIQHHLTSLFFSLFIQSFVFSFFDSFLLFSFLSSTSIYPPLPYFLLFCFLFTSSHHCFFYFYLYHSCFLIPLPGILFLLRPHLPKVRMQRVPRQPFHRHFLSIAASDM